MNIARLIIAALPLFAVQAITGCMAASKDETAAASSRTQDEHLDISLAHGSAPELATRAQLDRLLANYDLRPWLFTREVVIDEEAIPHSHPVLTLHTRHLRDDDQLLSTFIHEQTHWFLESRVAQTEKAVAELKSAFPSLPVGFPDGADSELSSYEHLLVIFLEHEGLARALGEPRTSQVFRFWEGDHYRALYELVRENRDELARTLVRNGLVPAFLQVDVPPAPPSNTPAPPSAEPSATPLSPTLLAPDGTPLPQTHDLPQADSPSLRQRLERLVDAIAHDDPERALPAFFPRVAYEQVKAIADPARDWQARLVRAFERDIHAYHQKLGRDAAGAQLVALVTTGRTPRWMEPGAEGNRLGYYRMTRTQLRLRLASGTERDLALTSLISWRGEWYVVHLAGFS